MSCVYTFGNSPQYHWVLRVLLKHLQMKNFKLAVLVAVVLSLLYSCMTDSKALQTVLTKKPLFDTVGKVYTQLHPCDPISIVHHSDTSYLHDTSIVTCHDTIGNYIHDTTTITHTNTIHIHDKDTIVDNQQIKILESQIENKNKQIAALNQAVTDSRLQAASNEKDASKWELYFWLLIAAIVIALVLYIIKPRL